MNDTLPRLDREFAEEYVTDDLIVVDGDKGHDHDSGAPQPVHDLCFFVPSEGKAV